MSVSFFTVKSGLLLLSQKLFKELGVQKLYQDDFEDIKLVLQRCGIFGNLPEEKLNQLAKVLRNK